MFLARKEVKVVYDSARLGLLSVKVLFSVVRCVAQRRAHISVVPVVLSWLMLLLIMLMLMSSLLRARAPLSSVNLLPNYKVRLGYFMDLGFIIRCPSKLFARSSANGIYGRPSPMIQHETQDTLNRPSITSCLSHVARPATALLLHHTQ